MPDKRESTKFCEGIKLVSLQALVAVVMTKDGRKTVTAISERHVGRVMGLGAWSELGPSLWSSLLVQLLALEHQANKTQRLDRLSEVAKIKREQGDQGWTENGDYNFQNCEPGG